MKLKKYYLIFLVLYLLALILAGANPYGGYPGSVLSKMLGFLWSLAPSQTFGWWAISGVVLVILIILGFVAGCKLIAYFMRKEEDQRRE